MRKGKGPSPSERKGERDRQTGKGRGEEKWPHLPLRERIIFTFTGVTLDGFSLVILNGWTQERGRRRLPSHRCNSAFYPDCMGKRREVKGEREKMDSFANVDTCGYSLIILIIMSLSLFQYITSSSLDFRSPRSFRVTHLNLHSPTIKMRNGQFSFSFPLIFSLWTIIRMYLIHKDGKATQ